MGKTKFQIDLGLSDIKIKSINRDNFGDYHIYVSCTAKQAICHNCGKTIRKSHGQCQETIIEDLPIRDQKVFIHVKWPRFMCVDCDGNPTTSFKPDWLSDCGTKTKAYERYILKCLVNSTVEDVAIKHRTSGEIVQGIIDRNITSEINWSSVSPTVIGIDEISMRKGHYYYTIVYDMSVKGRVKVLFVIEGREKEDVLKMLKTIPLSVASNLKSICVDMSSSYIPAVKDWLTNIGLSWKEILTIDRFHLAKSLGDLADKERKKTINDLKLAFTIYEISEKALYKLSDQGIAVEVINSLKSLKGMKIQGRDQFLDQIRQVVDGAKFKVVSSIMFKLCKTSDNEEVLEQLKRIMWPFRKHEKDLDEKEQTKLDDLFKLSPQLKQVYYFREA